MLRRPVPHGFWDGFRAFFRGFVLLAKTPGTLPLALVPAAMVLAITMGMWTLAVFFIPALADHWAGGDAGIGLSALAALTIATGCFLAGTTFAQPACGPALDTIVRKVAADTRQPMPPSDGFIAEVTCAAASSIVVLVPALALHVGLIALSLRIGAPYLFAPVAIALSLAALTLNGLNLALSARGESLGSRIQVLRAGSTLGYAAAGVLAVFIPGAILLFLPASAASGASRKSPRNG